jgi:hypothetical protein
MASWTDCGLRGAADGRWWHRAATGPTTNIRVVPCWPTGLGCGPGTTCTSVPCQPGPTGLCAGPCLGQAKMTGFVLGRQARGCMPKYTRIPSKDASGPACGRPPRFCNNCMARLRLCLVPPKMYYSKKKIPRHIKLAIHA